MPPWCFICARPSLPLHASNPNTGPKHSTLHNCSSLPKLVPLPSSRWCAFARPWKPSAGLLQDPVHHMLKPNIWLSHPKRVYQQQIEALSLQTTLTASQLVSNTVQQLHVGAGVPAESGLGAKRLRVSLAMCILRPFWQRGA